ncbi:hypothetical protein A7M79_07390 [Acinetobacter baumannii]|uniref:hypothetical protein n=1 Tax=Acinetobacter baumannii TaxID=470 RepID=UPI0008DD929F|nr:hypothetical protein [Acinetobacter baumannii]OIH08630.1 hypothetical protein A7M79_07390 [Acinetobacter baumannii]
MKLFLEKMIDPDDKKFHQKYSILNNLSCERELVQKWSEGFVDRDHKIVGEFQRSFHSSLWEFYIHQLLKNMNSIIDFSKNRPDFIVKNSDGTDRFYIEARISGIKKGGRLESERNLGDLFDTETPVWKLDEFKNIIDEGIIRCSSGFLYKAEDMYDSYKEDEWFNQKVPYIIGLASFSQINYGLESHYSILALLYGQYVMSGGHTFGKCQKVFKENRKNNKKVLIKTNLFNDKKYSHVAAVLFSSKLTLGKLTALSLSKGDFSLNSVMNVYHDIANKKYDVEVISEKNPEHFADGLFLFHNPNADCPLDPKEFLNQGIIQVFQKNKKLIFSNNRKPLVCRVNRSGMKHIAYLQKLSLDELYNNKI